MSRRTASIPLPGRFAVAVNLLAAGLAVADVTTVQWQSDYDYEYHVNWMLDLDQRRSGLLDNGAAHCVPTSHMNLLGYAANFGFPDLSPGPGTWTDPSVHNQMTNQVQFLGSIMNTNGGGTTLSGMREGMELWIGDRPITCDAKWFARDGAPTISNLVQDLRGGHIATVWYGRWSWTPATASIAALGTRTGGHSVTVMHAEANGPGTEQLWVCDPADDPSPFDLNTQSEFRYRMFDVDVTANLQHDLDGDGEFVPFIGVTLDWDGFSPVLRLMDGYNIMRPTEGLYFNNVVVAVQGLVQDGWLSYAPPTPPEPYTGTNIVSVAPFIGFNDFLIAESGAGSSSLRIWNQHDGVRSEEVALNFTMIDTYVDPNGVPFVAGPLVIERRSPTNLGFSTAVYNPPYPIDAMAGDDDRGVVWAYSSDIKSLIRLDAETLSPYTSTTIPLPSYYPSTPMVDLDVCPENGYLWATFEGSDEVWWIIISLYDIAFGSGWGDPGLQDPLSVSCDGEGQVVVSDGTDLHVFRRQTNGDWVVVDDPKYANISGTGKFIADHGRTNYDPEIHSSIGWNTNIPADELAPATTFAPCYADVNLDHQVDVHDLLELLEVWGTDDARSDITPFGGDGSVDVSDLLDLLAAWGLCD